MVALRLHAAAFLLVLLSALTPARAESRQEAPAAARAASGGTAPASRPDPVLAAVMGVLPLLSGYYLTSTPEKGVIFTLADAVLMGAIYNVRRDEYLPDSDVGMYFAMLGLVNAADAVLSAMQARRDASVTLGLSLNPHGSPVLGLAWRF